MRTRKTTSSCSTLSSCMRSSTEKERSSCAQCARRSAAASADSWAAPPTPSPTDMAPTEALPGSSCGVAPAPMPAPPTARMPPLPVEPKEPRRSMGDRRPPLAALLTLLWRCMLGVTKLSAERGRGDVAATAPAPPPAPPAAGALMRSMRVLCRRSVRLRLRKSARPQLRCAGFTGRQPSSAGPPDDVRMMLLFRRISAGLRMEPTRGPPAAPTPAPGGMTARRLRRAMDRRVASKRSSSSQPPGK